jgi:N-acetyl-alpha-D-muramate 1-phosphate uridylyltransferase
MNVTGMILAAGRGERMRPLTQTLPKPLVLVRGKPLVVHHIEKFVAMGITDVVINVSYLAEKIEAALGDGSQFGCSIRYSFEPEPLESGGGVATASALFANELFIVASADIYSEIDYNQLLPFSPISTGDHELSWDQEFDAHFVLISPRENEPGREFALGENHRLNEGEPRQTLANISVMKTELVRAWPRGQKFKLLPYYREWVARGRASGEMFHDRWCNVTTITDVEQLNAL